MYGDVRRIGEGRTARWVRAGMRGSRSGREGEQENMAWPEGGVRSPARRRCIKNKVRAWRLALSPGTRQAEAEAGRVDEREESQERDWEEEEDEGLAPAVGRAEVV